VEEEELRELLDEAARHAEELLRTLKHYREYLLNTPILKMTPEDLALVRETTKKIRAIESFLAAQRKHLIGKETALRVAPARG